MLHPGPPGPTGQLGELTVLLRPLVGGKGTSHSQAPHRLCPLSFALSALQASPFPSISQCCRHIGAYACNSRPPVTNAAMQAGCLSPILRSLSPKLNVQQSVTHGQCDADPTVTFASRWHCHWPIAGTHFTLHYLKGSSPAHVVQWSNHLGAMCSRAWRSQWPRIDSSLGPGASAY